MKTKNITPCHSRENGNPAETSVCCKTDIFGAGSPRSRGWRKSYSGFTLVELIVVITILVILGTIAFTSLSGFSGSARDGSRVSDLANLSKSLDIASVKTGSYPLPDNAFSVTYSWGVLWNQGTVWDTVMNILSTGGAKMNKKPTDPLTPTKEYTYSILAFGNGYQLKTDYEGDSVAFSTREKGDTLSLRGTKQSRSNNLFSFSQVPWKNKEEYPGLLHFVRNDNILIDQANAASGNPTLTYIKGNYNGIAAKTITGSITYLVATPSIITSQTGATGSGFDVISALSNKLFTHGSTNSGGIIYTAKLVFSSGALPSTTSDYILFASGIANVYSGTSLATNTTIASYITALSSNNTGTLASLGSSFVSSSLGGSASSTSGGSGGGTSYTCAANPSFSNLGTLTTGTPTSASQAWTYNASNTGPCTYACINGYSLNNCATAPIPAYSSTSSTTAYTAGMQFTYSWVTVTVTSAGIGTGSSTYAGCDTPDIVIWASGYNPQIWAACNVGATTSAGFASVPTQSPNPSVDAATLPTNRVASVQGNYYQWGRNDNVTSGTWTTSQWGGAFTSPANTTGNTNFYQGESTYGDWKWGGATNPAGGWNTANGGDNNLPCATGYHVPTDDATVNTDWPKASQLIVGTVSPSGTQYDTIRSTMKLPLAGGRHWTLGLYYGQGSYGYYWSSTPNSAYSYNALFSSGGGGIAYNGSRGLGFSVRCLKN